MEFSPFDQSKRGKRVLSVVKAVRAFFKKYNDYTFAFSIGRCQLFLFMFQIVVFLINYLFIFYLGTQFHEGCVFVRKVERKYHILHYNPTFDSHVTIFGEFIFKLEVETEIYGYQDVDNNKDGYCTFLAWVEMVFLFLGKKKSV